MPHRLHARPLRSFVSSSLLRSVGLALVVSATVTGACDPPDGDDPAETCGPVTECGGDIVGSWHATAVCGDPNVAPPPEYAWPECPGYVGTSQLVMADDAFIAFNADGSFVKGLSFRMILHETIPIACVGAPDCSPLDSAVESCTFDGASCDCTSEIGPLGATAYGTYTTDHGLTLSAYGSETPVTRCAHGDTLTVSFVEGGRRMHARLERGASDTFVGNAQISVLNLAAAPIDHVHVGDAPLDVINSGRAGLTRPVSSGPTKVSWTLDGTVHSTTVEARVGGPLTVVVRDGGGADSMVVDRPADDGDIDITVVNTFDRPIDVTVSERLPIHLLAGETSAPFSHFFGESDVEVQAGSGAVANRFDMPSSYGSKTLFVAPDGLGGARVIVDDTRSYLWLGAAPETARVRFVHAAPQQTPMVVSSVASPLSRPFDSWQGDVLFYEQAFGSASDYADVPIGYERFSVGYFGDPLAQLRTDVPLYPAGSTYLLALVEGPEGPALALYPDDIDEAHRLSVTFVAGPSESVRPGIGDAMLTATIAPGSSQRVALDALDELVLHFGDAAGTSGRYALAGPLPDGPVLIFVLADRTLMVVDADSHVQRIEPQGAPR